jgi:hypothetical protein
MRWRRWAKIALGSWLVRATRLRDSHVRGGRTPAVITSEANTNKKGSWGKEGQK